MEGLLIHSALVIASLWRTWNKVFAFTI